MFLSTWPSAFVATALVEVPIVVIATRATPWPAWRRAAIGMFAQLATHPIVWFVVPQIPGLDWRSALWLSELWAVFAEGCLYALTLPGVRPWTAFGLSALANGASLGIGVALRGWIVTGS
jgi:hypothetical protein